MYVIQKKSDYNLDKEFWFHAVKCYNNVKAGVIVLFCVQEHRGLLSVRYPMEHGIVKDWNDMERIWQYVYSKEQLQTFSEEVRV